MGINRKALVQRHNPRLRAVTPHAPLTVGNGNFAFNADITGLQTLYDEHLEVTPLCTMADWGWHSTPNLPAPTALRATPYAFNGRTVHYDVECYPGNDAIYRSLRENPHRLNLARIALCWDGEEAHDIEPHGQSLDLWTGILTSRFAIHGFDCHVRTAVDPDEDRLAFELSGAAVESGHLQLSLRFPYGSAAIHASDWTQPGRHRTTLIDGARIQHELDDCSYQVAVFGEGTVLEPSGSQRFLLTLPATSSQRIDIVFTQVGETQAGVKDVFARSEAHWSAFWLDGGVVELAESRDPRALELERRIVLSQYLLAVHSAASQPPQETGLLCNSWYGKFHLEMHAIHAASFPQWRRGYLLERSFDWYHAILPAARANAARNGFAGARWPKMVGPEGIDSPSPIAPLLIWQQPHLLWMLEACWQEGRDPNFLETHWVLVRETATFMADYAVYHHERDAYELLPPLIPVQEEFDPRGVRNPTFELEYWRAGLAIAARWAKRLGHEVPERWQAVAEKLARPHVRDGLIEAHADTDATYRDYRRDHPSFLYAYGLLPGDRLAARDVEASLRRVLELWDEASLWGWDYGLMAMTAVRLGLPELAIDILMHDSPKNSYVENGQNLQVGRPDLPAYLPGNGALLLAIAMMCAGYQGATKALPGFPDDGDWVVHYESIDRLIF